MSSAKAEEKTAEDAALSAGHLPCQSAPASAASLSTHADLRPARERTLTLARCDAVGREKHKADRSLENVRDMDRDSKHGQLHRPEKKKHYRDILCIFELTH